MNFSYEFFFGESLYLILYMDKKRFQAGSFETYFYSDGIHLSEYLFNKEYGVGNER